MKTKKIECMVLVLLIFCISHLLAEPCGDVNSDGAIDIVDALLIAQHYVGFNPENFDEPAGDVNNDGVADILDALLVAQFYVGLIPALPGCDETPTPTPDLTLVPTVDPECPYVGPPGYYCCADEGESVTFEVEVNVAYGANGSFNFLYNVTGTITFNNSTFGDPIYGVEKHGFYQEAGSPTPTPSPTPIPTPSPTPIPTPVPGQISLYRVFERALTNDKNYSNKFTDVELLVSYTSPSGKNIDFMGFFDGDGEGGGSMSSGNVWKMRFMPDEPGTWNYTWSWSDGTPGGQGEFTCTSTGAGKGILRAYQDNPRWFAYNGTEPVYIKSYYESSMRPFAQPWDCAEDFYQAFLDNGYNYLMVNWLLPSVSGENLSCSSPSSNKATYEEKGKASTTMNLDVWNKMEVLLSWLNDKDVSLFMFLGFDGGRNDRPQAWASLSAFEQDFFARYVVSRIAPYAIITWNYVWEVAGDTENGELGCMRLVQKYDVFNHLRTYHDEWPKYNEFHRPEYTFAGVENHRIHSDDREPEYWPTSWTHHDACLLGYVPGKPVFMVEGNALWRRFWYNHIKNTTGHSVTQAEVRQAAWACATAAASFTWCGHTSLSLGGSSGIPFYDNAGNSYRAAAKSIDLLVDIMNNEVAFYRMTPQDGLLSGHDNHNVWCLAEPGSQYLVFAASGRSFTLNLEAGQYSNNVWIDTITGNEQTAPSVTGGTTRNFTPPDTSTDWVLILRS